MFSQTLLPALLSILSIPLVSASPIFVQPTTPAIVELSAVATATTKILSIHPNKCFTPHNPVSAEFHFSVLTAPVCGAGQEPVYRLHQREKCEGTSGVWRADEMRAFPLTGRMSILFFCAEKALELEELEELEDLEVEFKLLEYDTKWLEGAKDHKAMLMEKLSALEKQIEEERMKIKGLEEEAERLRMKVVKGDEDDEDEDDDEDPVHPPTRQPKNQGNPFVILGLILLVSLLILVFTIIKCVMQGKRLVDRVMKMYDAFQSRRTEGQIVLEG